MDSTTIEENFKPARINDKFDIKNVKIAIPKEYENSAITAEILEAWKYIANIFKNAGASVQEVNIVRILIYIVTVYFYF